MISKRQLLLVLPVLLFSLALSGSGSAEIIPLDRRIDWMGNVGVTGDIPTTRIQCGPTINPSGQTDGNTDTAAIRNALAICAAGHYVKLAAGTFYISGTIAPPDNVTLKGNGIGSTYLVTVSGIGPIFRLQAACSTSGDGCIYTGFSDLAGINVTSGATKGSTTIVTSSAHGLSASDQIGIDELCDASADPPIDCYSGGGMYGRDDGTRQDGQINKVVSVINSTTFVVETPLYKNYTRTPQIAKMPAPRVGAGIEDMSVDLTNIGDYFAIQIYNARDCYLKNLELYNSSHRAAIYVYSSYRNTIRSCYLHGFTFGSSTGYGIELLHTSGNVIEDSIFYNMGAPILYIGMTSGNVIAYNYFTLMRSDSSYQPYAIGSHGANPIFNLLEGNYIESGLIGFDNYWGGSTWNTVFRSKSVFDRSTESCDGVQCDGQMHRVASGEHNTYTNIVGNVLGDSWETSYCAGNYGAKSIFNLNGCTRDGNLAFTSSLIHANWDSVNNAVTKCNNAANPGCFGIDPDNLSIPNSYYLASKPSWFGSVPWPPIGPDVSGYANKIPAQLRYEAMTAPQTCSSLGGSCCSLGQICSGGSFLPSSNCAHCCVGGTCYIPVCGNSQCESGETCSSCPSDCPTPGGQMCCSGSLYPGNCCSSSDCTSPQICINNICSNPPSGGLVAAYSFDEGAGTTAHDSSGNGNTGAISGAVWAAGKYGSALTFDGVDDYVEAKDSPSLGITSSLTISAWIYIKNQANHFPIAYKYWDSADVGGFYLIVSKISEGAYLHFGHNNGMTGEDFYDNVYYTSLSANTWYQVAVTFSNTKETLYLNGIQIRSKVPTVTSIDVVNQPLRIGYTTDAYYEDYANGLIDEVRIYNRTLNQSEIQADMNIPISTSCHKSDTNCDGCVDIIELGDFITRWKLDSTDVTIKQLIEAISLWKKGCS